eukprot:15330350-Ditylum_brightwellii.AAC.1
MECLQPRKLLAAVAINTTGAKTMCTYKLVINLSVPETDDKFNMHQHFSRMMQEMLQTDRDLAVESATAENCWMTT